MTQPWTTRRSIVAARMRVSQADPLPATVLLSRRCGSGRRSGFGFRDIATTKRFLPNRPMSRAADRRGIAITRIGICVTR